MACDAQPSTGSGLLSFSSFSRVTDFSDIKSEIFKGCFKKKISHLWHTKNLWIHTKSISSPHTHSTHSLTHLRLVAIRRPQSLRLRTCELNGVVRGEAGRFYYEWLLDAISSERSSSFAPLNLNIWGDNSAKLSAVEGMTDSNLQRHQHSFQSAAGGLDKTRNRRTWAIVPIIQYFWKMISEDQSQK